MRSPFRLLAAIGAAALLVATTAGTAVAGNPMWGAPNVGECHVMTMDQAGAVSDITTPSDCAAGHKTRVIAVKELPAGLDWSSPSGKLANAAQRGCVPAFDTAVGSGYRTRDSSAYSYLFFYPTADQQSHGARWYSCHVALRGGGKLANLPTDDAPAITGTPLADTTARCLTATSLATTTCSRGHTWRATGTFTMDSDTFPGATKIASAAAKRCPGHVRTREFSWTYRYAVQWRLGDHVVVCYTKTSA